MGEILLGFALIAVSFSDRAWLCAPAFIPTRRGGRRLSRPVIGAVSPFQPRAWFCARDNLFVQAERK